MNGDENLFLSSKWPALIFVSTKESRLEYPQQHIEAASGSKTNKTLWNSSSPASLEAEQRVSDGK